METWSVMRSECLFLPSPPFMCWNPHAWCKVLGDKALGRCLGHEVGALMNGINIFIKETSQIFLTPFTGREHHGCSARFWQWTRKELSTEHHHPGAYILDFPVSRTVKNKFLLLINYLVCWYLLEQPADQDQEYI